METTKLSIQHLRTTIDSESVFIQSILITVEKIRTIYPTNKLESHQIDFLFSSKTLTKTVPVELVKYFLRTFRNMFVPGVNRIIISVEK